MNYLNAFIFAGIVCAIGQVLLDYTKLTPGHVTSIFVVTGAALDTFSLYDKFVLWAGGGALVPITSFGHLLMHSAMASAQNEGFFGLALGMFNLTASGISAAIVIAFFMAVFFKPKG